jgi:hypothetical protein
MNKKIILGLLLLSIVYLIVYNPKYLIEKFTATLHTLHPPGSYINKCKQIFYDGYHLRALCPNMDNKYIQTVYCTDDCPCTNKNGTMELKCGCTTNKFGVDENGELICEK